MLLHTFRCATSTFRAASRASFKGISTTPARRPERTAAVMAEPNNSPDQVKLALCQITVTSDKDENIASAKRFVEESAEKGAQVVVLPEMWNCPYSNDCFPEYAEDIKSRQSKSFSAMQGLAKDLSIVLIGGSIPEQDGSKVYNTCCVFDTDGSLLGKHRKTHLFDVDIPGKVTFKESDTLTAGESLTCVDTKYGKIGVGICYDLRFPELCMAYRQRGARLVVYPGAFNMTTGPVHWQLLQQARAVDNQLFIASCSPARNLDSSYTAWGHSMVVGPFGEVLAQLEDESNILTHTLDMKQMETRRENMPLESQRRLDLYEFSDKQA